MWAFRSCGTLLTFFTLCGASSVSAATISVTYGGVSCGAAAGLCTSVAAATTVTFDDADGLSLPSVFGVAQYLGNAGLRSSVEDSPFVTGRKGGYWEAPFENNTRFLTVGSPALPGPVTIAFSTPINYFGMYVGSPDPYNSIEFYSGGTLLGAFSGSAIINPADSALRSAGFVNFSIDGGSADRIVMNSGIAAFETDNHAFVTVHAPEPMTMGLAGTALIAFVLARRRVRRAGRQD
jgi:hypothetical protein